MKDPLMVILSVIALGFVYLAYKIDWLFLVGAVAIIVYNQRRILKK